MSDDARLQRLTELARKVWPGFGPLTVALRHSGATVQVYNKDQFQAVIFDHPRALDALEAALLVLDMSPERAARLLHGMRTYGECPCAKCEQERALMSEKKC